jgi:hypothetical protein
MHMREWLPTLIFVAGFTQWSVLVASALVPIRLQWKTALSSLPYLYRQLFWVYGLYIVMAIIAGGAMCVFNAYELAGGGALARWICGYLAVFWGVRLSLQTVLDVKPFLTAWWLTAGYHLLTVLFVSFTALFAFTAFF